MASESSEKDVVTGGLSEELDAWLRDRADDLGLSREELLARLVGSYRLVVESDGDGATLGAGSDGIDLDGMVGEAVDEQVSEAVDEQVSEAVDERVEGRIDDLEADVDGKLEEVRTRVVQLKGEVDAAADADHDHEAFERVEELAGKLADLEETVAALRESEPDEEGRIADLEEKLTAVASAVVELREADRTGGVEGTRRTALDELKRLAGEHGVEIADCDACGSEVNLALLTEPACPHCETELRDLSVSSGFLFDSATVGGGNDGGSPGGGS